MKIGIKRMTVICMIVSAVFLLSGCIFDVSDVDLLSKPKLPLELEEISQVLKAHFNEDIQLISPLKGDNKKSVQFIDLDQDGENEVVVLHAKESDEYAMKVTVLSKKNNKWRINTDIQGIGYDINKIDFPDLDGDGVREIVVGWQSGAQLNKGLSVYRHGANGYEEIYKDSYTEFVTGDLNGDHQDELAILKLSRSEALAKAKILSIVNKKVTLIAESYMDGFINEYAAVKMGLVNHKQIALVVDAKVGARSGFTDVFFMKEGSLKNLFFDPKWKITNATYRPVGRTTTDINDDGILEIPTLIKANFYEKPSSKLVNYLTVWNNIDDAGKLKPVMKTYDDIENGYQFVFPANWGEQIGVTKEAEGAIFNCYANGKDAIPLFEVQYVDRKNWEATKNKYLEKGYFELGKNLDKVYLGRTHGSSNTQVVPLLIDEKMGQQLFKIL